jgi:hypothetical protein
VRSFSELAGKDLIWKVQPGSASIPDQAQHSYVLFMDGEPVVQAQVMWQRLVYYDVIVEAGEGTFQVHMNLADPARQTVAWKTGLSESLAGFRIASEELITATGWISTAGGRTLAWEPTHPNGYEYVIFVPGGPRLVTLSAAFSLGTNLAGHMGGNPGHMLIASEEADDPELPALVALNFALANEQVVLLHRDMNAPGGGLPEGVQPIGTEGVLKLIRDANARGGGLPAGAGPPMSLEDVLKLLGGKPPTT